MAIIDVTNSFEGRRFPRQRTIDVIFESAISRIARHAPSMLLSLRAKAIKIPIFVKRDVKAYFSGFLWGTRSNKMIRSKEGLSCLL
jgi:hypothetical protein